MKSLLEFLVKKITGSDDFSITESELSGGHVNLEVAANPEIAGLIIGKEGKTIKNLRRILAVRALKEKKTVSISVTG